MAEQVVDIRERIEKMRTQIYEKPGLEKNEGRFPEDKTSNVIKKPEIFPETSKNYPTIQKNNEQETENLKNISSQSKIPSSLEQEKFISEKLQKKSISNNLKNRIQSNKNEPEKTNVEEKKIEESFFEKEKLSQKTYKDYHLKNTIDEHKKTVEMKDNTQAFPQFSLNVNNPISWKLMLLIMLMQLLTNIMLVVVLYLK